MQEYVFRVERERLTFGDLYLKNDLIKRIADTPAPLEDLLNFFARYAIDPVSKAYLDPEQARAQVFSIPFEQVVPTFYKLCAAISEVMLPPVNGKP